MLAKQIQQKNILHKFSSHVRYERHDVGRAATAVHFIAFFLCSSSYEKCIHEMEEILASVQFDGDRECKIGLSHE